MSLDMDQLIYDAKILAERLKDKECDADNLISQTQNLQNKVIAMKQYQDDILDMNEQSHQKPRSSVIREIAKENHIIRDLQQENQELRLTLGEYETALEMIMTKYREQISRLVAAKRRHSDFTQPDQSQEVNRLIDKVCEMASVMHRAAEIDEMTDSVDMNSMIEKLQQENRGLRELLSISTTDIRRMISDCDENNSQALNASVCSSGSESSSLITSVVAAANFISNDNT